MNITLVYDNIEHQNLTAILFDEAGYTVNQTFSTDSPWFTLIIQESPDLLVISIDKPDNDLYKQLTLLREKISPSVIVLTHSTDHHVIEKTILAGADSCIVGKLSFERLKSVINIAIARHKVNLKRDEEIMELKQEVESLESRLSDRIDIDRAKGVLMQSYNMNENDAYNSMRNMAMDTGNKIGEVARNLISMSKILN